MVLCPGSPCRLRQGFHSPVRSSPVLCTQPILTLFNTTSLAPSGGKPQDRECSEGVVGGGGGVRQRLSRQSLLAESPRALGAAGCASPAHPAPACPHTSQPDIRPALRQLFPQTLTGANLFPRHPPGQWDGTCHHTRSQHPACLDPRLSLIPACFKSRPSAKPEES